jgi:heme exporter protein D
VLRGPACPIMAEIDLDGRSGQDGVPVGQFWESFRLDPRQAGNASMRASDADREIVRAVLADAYADGRLTGEEHDDRLTTLYGSRTLGELPALVADLMPAVAPPAAPAPADSADLRVRGARKWRKDVEESFGAFLFPSVVCTVIWIAVGGHGFFWPLFPMVFLGLNLIKTVVQRESAIEREVRRLEKQAIEKKAQDS